MISALGCLLIANIKRLRAFLALCKCCRFQLTPKIKLLRSLQALGLDSLNLIFATFNRAFGLVIQAKGGGVFQAEAGISEESWSKFRFDHSIS